MALITDNLLSPKDFIIRMLTIKNLGTIANRLQY